MNPTPIPWAKATNEVSAQSDVEPLVRCDDYNSVARDAARYRWLRKHYEWCRSGQLVDDDSHGYIKVRVPYLANLSCGAMLDYVIDTLMIDT